MLRTLHTALQILHPLENSLTSEAEAGRKQSSAVNLSVPFDRRLATASPYCALLELEVQQNYRGTRAIGDFGHCKPYYSVVNLYQCSYTIPTVL